MLSYIKLTLFIQYASHLPTPTLFAVRERQGGRTRTATLSFAFSSVADGERQITQQESVGNTYYDTALIITVHKKRGLLQEPSLLISKEDYFLMYFFLPSMM